MALGHFKQSREAAREFHFAGSRDGACMQPSNHWSSFAFPLFWWLVENSLTGSPCKTKMSYLLLVFLQRYHHSLSTLGTLMRGSNHMASFRMATLLSPLPKPTCSVYFHACTQRKHGRSNRGSYVYANGSWVQAEVKAWWEVFKEIGAGVCLKEGYAEALLFPTNGIV